jgi:hypothetical protein
VAFENTCTYTTGDSIIFAQTVIAAAMYLANVGKVFQVGENFMVTVTLSAALVHTVLGALGARCTSLHVLEVGDTTWLVVGGNRLPLIYV